MSGVRKFFGSGASPYLLAASTLLLGMAGQAEGGTDNRSLLSILLQKIRRTISLG